MKRLLALALVVLAAPLLAAPRDWTTVARQSPAGAWLVGNPAAKAKLVEYASYVCPHCAHFSEEGGPALRKLIASGSTSLEVRPLIADPIDLAAALTARCSGPTRFLAVNEAIFAGQDGWYSRARDYIRTNPRLSSYPAVDQVKAIAEGSGLTDIAVAKGVAKPALSACIAAPATLAATLKVDAAARTVAQGTPTFVLNGRVITGAGWAELDPQLRAAGAR